MTSLVKKLDPEIAKNKSARMHAVVVLLSDDENAEKKLKDLAEQGIKHISLGIDNPAGPKGYNVAKDADVTVVLYNKRKIAANHAFKKGDLNDKGIDAIVADVPKIVK